MIDKRLDIAECIKEIKSNDTIVIGGWGAFRKPMALIKELIRSPVKDLTILSYAGMDLDILIGAGMVKNAVFGFVAFEDAPGQPGNFKRARMEGTVEMTELSEYLFMCQFKAGAERLPFFPVRGGIGTDILTTNPNIKTITDPYEGETFVAMPAVHPDYALIHVNEADQLGNVNIFSDPFLDPLFVRAAKKVIISTEKIIPVGKIKQSAIMIGCATAVVEAPMGALPGACSPDYTFNPEDFIKYNKVANDPASFQTYLQKLREE